MAKKIKNKRCPFQNECERSCEHINTELNCDYYKNNAVGETVIPDQEDMRNQLEKLKAQKDFEERISALPDDEQQEKGEKNIMKEIVYLPIAELYEHPDNPRKDIGDISELADSIRAKGVMQNLTVVKGHYENGSREAVDGGYTVIIGHRRRAGAIEAGLEVLPCVIVDMDYKEQVSTMLLENMQRVDLTAFEQAQGFQMMMDLGDTVEGIAEKTGFSKKTVKHRLEMAKLNATKLKEVSGRQITIGEFEQLERVKDIETRNKLLEKIGTYNFNGAVETAVRTEAFLEWLPDVTERLEALGAKVLSDSERYSSKYEYLGALSMSDKLSDDKPIIPKKYHKDELVYIKNGYSYNINYYRKKPKEKKDTRPKAWIEREKDIKTRTAILKNMTEMAYILRFNFAKGLVMHANDREKIMLGAVGVCSVFTFNYLYSKSAKEFLEYMGEKTSDDWKENVAAAYKLVKDKPTRAIPGVIYTAFNDTNANGFYETRYDDYPRHKVNAALDALYDWLESLGYELSDDERQLRDGTHEIFKVDK